MNSYEILLETRVFLEQKKELPAKNLKWLIAGIDGYLDDGAAFEKTLGLNDARFEYLITARDKHLINALRAVQGNLSDWKSCLALSSIISRFKTGRWKKIRYLVEPPDNLSPVNKNLFYALKTGLDVPESAHQIRNILVKSKSYTI